VLTVLPLDAKTKVAEPPQLDVPVQVPANFAPSLPLGLLVHEESEIVVNDKMARIVITILLVVVFLLVISLILKVHRKIICFLKTCTYIFVSVQFFV
jgi:hypothetical protein